MNCDKMCYLKILWYCWMMMINVSGKINFIYSKKSPKSWDSHCRNSLQCCYDINNNKCDLASRQENEKKIKWRGRMILPYKNVVSGYPDQISAIIYLQVQYWLEIARYCATLICNYKDLYYRLIRNAQCQYIHIHRRSNFFPKCGVTECSTTKEFARFKISSSAVPHIFTGGRNNVALLNRNALWWPKTLMQERNKLYC